MKLCYCGKPLGRKSIKYCSYACFHAKINMHGVNNPRYGARLSDETKTKISIGNKGKLKGRPSPLQGRTHTLEHNAKIAESTSKALRAPGMKTKLQTMLGRHHTEESKQKSSASNIGQVRSEEARKKMREGYNPHPSPFKGKTNPPDVRARQRAGMLKKILSKELYLSRPELAVKNMFLNIGFFELKKGAPPNPGRIQFIHQKYMHIKHAYVADFVFPKIKAVIEEDGLYFHKGARLELDAVRTKEMEAQGYTVLRVTDVEVMKTPKAARAKINRFIVDCEIDKLLPKIGINKADLVVA